MVLHRQLRQRVLAKAKAKAAAKGDGKAAEMEVVAAKAAEKGAGKAGKGAGAETAKAQTGAKAPPSMIAPPLQPTGSSPAMAVEKGDGKAARKHQGRLQGNTL